MKTTLPAMLTALIAAGSLVTTAVAQNKDTPPPNRPPAVRADTPHRVGRGVDTVSEPAPAPADETDFVHKAAMGGRGEVKLAELGVKKAQDGKIKECAEMLVKEHTAVNLELKAIAEMMKIRLDDALDPKIEKTHEELSQKSGKEFDKAFLQEMASCHERGISLFEGGKKVAKEKQLTAFIEKALPALRSHAQKIAEIGGWEPSLPGPRPKPVVDPAPEVETKPSVVRPTGLRLSRGPIAGN